HGPDPLWASLSQPPALRPYRARMAQSCVPRTIPSRRAWAMISRSNGSLWCGRQTASVFGVGTGYRQDFEAEGQHRGDGRSVEAKFSDLGIHRQSWFTVYRKGHPAKHSNARNARGRIAKEGLMAARRETGWNERGLRG